MKAWVYVLRCVDGCYYVGSYRGDDIETRVSEHNYGIHPGAWTYNRGPVELMWSQTFPRIQDAIATEQQMKKWSRAKKEAVIRGDWSALPELARCRSRPRDK